MCTMRTRFIVWLMILTACMVSYMLRVNMSINLIAMVVPTTRMSADNTSMSSLPECLRADTAASVQPHEKLIDVENYGSRYEWSSKVQGVILGSFFWGYIISSMPGGFLAERIGPTRIIGVTVAISAVLTILTPLAASLHYSYVIAVRILLGLFGGVVYPALHCLISRWSPPVEKGKFIGALMGGTLGTVFTWPFLGYVLSHYGWPWAFYVPGTLALLWALLWFRFVADSPSVHRYIADDERQYIIKHLKDAGGGVTSAVNKGVPPYGRIFTSVPFWALVVLHFGNLWGLYLLMTAGPKYMSEVLGYNLSESGVFAAMPYLARMLFGLMFGTIGDYIRKNNFMTVTMIRKSFILFSHVIPGCFLIGQTMSGCNTILAVSFLTLALGMNGASTVTNLQNSQDLSPRYAGTLYGIVNCIGGTTGFITPIVTGILTEHQNGLEEWRIIFLIGAAVYILCGIFFCFCGSGDQQAWNDDGDDNPNTANKSNSVFEATVLGVTNEAFVPEITAITKV